MGSDLTDLPLHSGEPRESGAEKAAAVPGGAVPRPASPGAATRRRRGAGDRALAAVAVALVLAGLTWRQNNRWMWGTGLWALFALFCAVTQLVAHLRSGSEKGWRIAALATTGLAGFWLLIVLPAIGSNAGFLLTAGLAAAGGALWLAPGRPR